MKIFGKTKKIYVKLNAQKRKISMHFIGFLRTLYKNLLNPELFVYSRNQKTEIGWNKTEDKKTKKNLKNWKHIICFSTTISKDSNETILNFCSTLEKSCMKNKNFIDCIVFLLLEIGLWLQGIWCLIEEFEQERNLFWKFYLLLCKQLFWTQLN